MLQASASIPAIFPAVRIPVSSGGETYEELHSDGGTSTQVFVAPEALLIGQAGFPMAAPKGSNLYIIVNNTLDPEFELVNDTTLAVAGRAYQTFIKTHLRSTINNAYLMARRGGLDFHLAYIRENVPYSTTDPFNAEYMKRLYQIGLKAGAKGDWMNGPPAGEASQPGGSVDGSRLVASR